MSLATTMEYEQTPVRPSKKKDLMVISEMTSSKIIRYLAYRHRVGLLATGNVLLVAYFAWDKVLHIFF